MDPQLRKCLHQTGLLTLFINDWCGMVQSPVVSPTLGTWSWVLWEANWAGRGNKPESSSLPWFPPWLPSAMDCDWMCGQTPFCAKLALARALLQRQKEVRRILCLFASSGKRFHFNVISAVHWNKWFQTKMLLTHIKIIIMPDGIRWNQVWFLRKPLFT